MLIGLSVDRSLDLGLISELAPGADNDMSQAHYDALGVWRTEPLSFSEGPSMVADVATTGFTLMRAGLEYVEAFTKLIVRNKPKRMLDASAAAEQKLAPSSDSETGLLHERVTVSVTRPDGPVWS
jgi:hypothetical protein